MPVHDNSPQSLEVHELDYVPGQHLNPQARHATDDNHPVTRTTWSTGGIMTRISTFFAYLHTLLIQVPQHGYHNISRIVQPQLRSISESILANSGRSKQDIELQTLKPKQKSGKEDPTLTSSAA